MERVAIFGVGLIGGSFALALRAAGFRGEITGVSSPATIAAALEMGVIHRGVTTEEAIAQADFLYLAQPIGAILDTLAAIGPRLRPGTVVTDAGSTKKQIVEQARTSVQQAFFVGGHPMAGKERSGVREAEATLFQGRPYVLTPSRPEDRESPAFRELLDWIERIGARPIVLDAEVHDRLVAYTSHVPQLLSTALASVLADIDGAPDVAGPAVLDLTRLALSPFSVWRDILKTNEKHIEEALSNLIVRLRYMQGQLDSGALGLEFERAAVAAKNLRKNLPD